MPSHCSSLITAVLLTLSFVLHSQVAEETVVPRAEYDQDSPLGPHHRKVENISTYRNDNGDAVTVTNRYVEVATGLNYKTQTGEWIASQEALEVIGNAIVARNGQHQVIFDANANSPGVMDMQLPDGSRLRGHVLGISLYNPTTGASEMIAEVKLSQAVLVPPNQVVYLDAFDTIHADLRYTYTKAGVEQDVILREQPELLEGFDNNSRLEVVTEFLDITVREKASNVIRGEKDAAKRAAMAEPDFVDENLNLGPMTMGPGRAFEIGAEAAVGPGIQGGMGARVGKRLHKVGSRTVLFEAVEIKDVLPSLQKLPKAQAARAKSIGRRMMASTGHGERNITWLPQKSLPVANPSGSNEIAIAKLDASAFARRPGFVLDYVVMGTASNMALKGDTTYLVTGPVYLSGLTTIEGGTVVKYDRDNPTNRVWIRCTGAIKTLTEPYRPALFVAKDDNSVGDAIVGSTGSPSGTYAQEALYFDSASNRVDLAHLRFRNHYVALTSVYATSALTIRHSHFTSCSYGLITYSCTVDSSIENCLITGTGIAALRSYSSALKGEHLTIDAINNVYVDDGGGSALSLTNSILTAIVFPNSHTYTSTSNYTNASATGIYSVVGAGRYYLPANSSLRNAGTHSISSLLRADLRRTTTYPPTVLATGLTLTTSSEWLPRVERDLDAPDLGYHYDPIDYAIDNLYIEGGTTLLVKPGTVIAAYGSNGFRPKNGALLALHGSSDERIVLTDFSTIQEHPSLWNKPVSLIQPNATTTNVAMVLRFSDLSLLSGNQNTIYSTKTGNQYNIQTLELKDCRIFNGSCYIGSATGATHSLFNNLFTRGTLCLSEEASLTCFNNTFYAVSMLFNQASAAQAWTIRDNIFDQCSYTVNTFSGTLNYGYNGYFAMSARLNAQQQASDITSSSAATWESGPIGSFYLPNNSTLLNVGSRTASAAGLYHYTTQASQMKETNSVVDIGYHSVSLMIRGPSGAARWSFDEATYNQNAFDSSTNALHGWFSDFPSGTRISNGYFSNAVIFASSAQLTMNNTAMGTYGNNLTSLTLGAWMFPTVLPTSPDSRVAGKGTNYYGLTYHTDGQVWFYINNNGNNVRAPVPTQTWTHVLGTFDGKSLRLYINGILRAEKAQSSHSSTGSGGEFWVGGPYPYFLGMIDEVSFSNTLLPVSSFGTPMDTDSDGIPDHREDLDGNGLVGSGELDWQSKTDVGLGVTLLQPKGDRGN